MFEAIVSNQIILSVPLNIPITWRETMTFLSKATNPLGYAYVCVCVCGGGGGTCGEGEECKLKLLSPCTPFLYDVLKTRNRLYSNGTSKSFRGKASAFRNPTISAQEIRATHKIRTASWSVSYILRTASRHYLTYRTEIATLHPKEIHL
jgi:hypothetical protein